MSTSARGALAPRAILFDAMGTLLELQAPAPRLRAELAGRFGIAVSEVEAERAIAAEIAYYRAHLDEGRDAESLAALRRRCAEALRAALPDGDGLDAGTLTDALLASLHFLPFADAAPALTQLRASGHRLAVVSNWDASLPDVLERVGLARLVDAVVTSAQAGARKPSVAIFERALSLLGESPGASVHVGDSIEEDAEGARNAGIQPVLLRRGGGPGPSGVRTISSLRELGV